MISELSPDTQAVLLLTAPLAVGGRAPAGPAPLADGEYKRLARGLREHGRAPADLFDGGAGETLAACAAELDRERIESLLGRGFLLSQAVERWGARGIRVVGRADPGYPPRLAERLGDRAPPILYGFGAFAALDEGGLGVVGSRNANDDALEAAGRAGRLAAGARLPLISGAARGVDRTAMSAALEAGGRAVGVLSDGLERAVTRSGDRETLMNGRLVLVSPFDPAARFQVWRAMQRNKLIYALADAAFVAAAEDGKSGAWAGAVEQLRAPPPRAPVYVRAAAAAEPGLAALRACGALPWPDPQASEALKDLLHETSPAPQSSLAQTPEPEVAESAPEPQPAPAEPPPGDPAARLRAAARACVLHACAAGPRTADDIAAALGVSKAQANDWLTRFAAEGAVEKTARPARYRASAPPAAAPPPSPFAAARPLLARLCAAAPQGEAAAAAALGVRKTQARAWLNDMAAAGLLVRRTAPVRFAAAQTDDLLFERNADCEGQG